MNRAVRVKACDPDTLDEQGGELKLDNAQEYLSRIVKQLRAQGAEKKGSLVTVLEYLSLHINHTREQIGTLRVGDPQSHALSGTAVQLEEVVSETAKATHDIISAAEEIEQLATKVEPQIGAGLSAAVIRIYEASAFQDISGQRIAKAIGALQFIDTRIAELIQACGPLPSAPLSQKSGDEALLNGPQLKQDASCQNEIDKLFGEG